MLQTITQKGRQGLNRSLRHQYKTLQIKVEDQIRDKFKSFNRWDVKKQLKNKKTIKKDPSLTKQETNSKNLLQAILNYTLNIKLQKEVSQQKKNVLVVEQLNGVKIQRRQRFKKIPNPIYLIRHYIQKESYEPSKQAMALMEKIVALKSTIEKDSNNDLQTLIKNIYKIMNRAVDYNQTLFFCLLIILVADICFQAKDYNRSFYFYNQARIASTHIENFKIKTQALMGMGKIALQIKKYNESIKLMKKCLQYAWKTKNSDIQLIIYDYIGQCFYYQGIIKKSVYFHTRYIQGELQLNSSAIKKISSEMLLEYLKGFQSLQKKDLSRLFIQYLDLPIQNFQIFSEAKKISNIKYPNYDQSGNSPRKNRETHRFQYHNFPKVQDQINTIFNEDSQFLSEIPNPNVHRNFVANNKYGKRHKDIQFTQTAQYHKLVGAQSVEMKFQSVYKYPLDVRIRKRLQDKLDPNWWQNMVRQTKKQRSQKVGRLKNRIFNSHEAYSKYPEQRRRTQSLKNQKIKESFNKTLLDFIDPSKP